MHVHAPRVQDKYRPTGHQCPLMLANIQGQGGGIAENVMQSRHLDRIIARCANGMSVSHVYMPLLIIMILASCIPKMDHHCPWTSNCVSHFTFPHFMRFLWYAVASMAYLEYLLFLRAQVIWQNRHLPSVWLVGA